MLNSNFLYDDQKQRLESAYGKDCFLSSPISTSTYTNAVILPPKQWINANMESTTGGGVCDNNGNFIDGTNIQTQTEEGYPYDDISYRIEDDVVYIGFMSECYGHMIMDSISKLWYIQTDDYRSAPLPLVYISEKPLKDWQLEILELVGVDVSNIRRITEITSFKSILIPDNSQIRATTGEHYWHAEFNDIIELMIHNALLREKVGTFKRIFFTRSQWNQSKREFGGERVESIFRKNGYIVCAPENLSIAKQIALLQGADELVCTEGSLSHNSLFMRPKSNVVLLRKGLYINAYSMMIDQVRHLTTILVDCSMSVINRKGEYAYHGPFFIYPNEQLCRYLNCTRPEFPYRSFRHYIKTVYRKTDFPESLIWETTYAKEMMMEFIYSRNLVEKRLLKILPVRIVRRVVNRIHSMRMERKIIGFF